MADDPSLHAFVLCWPGKEAGAHHIANAIDGHVDHLTVLYKNDTGVTEHGPGQWNKIPADWFYGKQFQESLRLNRGDIMLHIQADAGFHDWPSIISKCRDSFQRFPNVGVWAPNVYHSIWTPNVTAICPLRSNDILAVTMTDGIVWALSSPVIDRLKMLEYDINNFGWGICEAACAFAFTNNMLVLMDVSVKVDHPEGSGYCKAGALEQGQAFIKQLSSAELVQFNWVQLTKGIRERRLTRWEKPWSTLKRVFDEIHGRPRMARP
jgi:hypothetical protein